jgi:hypothetical protein
LDSRAETLAIVTPIHNRANCHICRTLAPFPYKRPHDICNPKSIHFASATCLKQRKECHIFCTGFVCFHLQPSETLYCIPAFLGSTRYWSLVCVFCEPIFQVLASPSSGSVYLAGSLVHVVLIPAFWGQSIWSRF